MDFSVGFLSFRHVFGGLFSLKFERTYTNGIGSRGLTAEASLPGRKAAFIQDVPMIMNVAGTPVGYGTVRLNGSTIFVSNAQYSAAVTLNGFGMVYLEEA